ncbi:MAG: MAPEG family protein, partial [Pseudomonadota bacterium]
MITSFYAGILAIMYLFMSTNVIKGRRANKISVGHADKKGENEDLLRRVRIHANFIEYVPIALILIFLLEI